MNKTLTGILCLLTVLGVLSCSDDKEPNIMVWGAVETPQLTIDDVTTNSVTYSWQPIEGVYQYGYKIVSETGECVDGGVTTETSQVFSDLEAYNNYTIMVKAFPAILCTGESGYATAHIKTPFYDELPNSTTSYVSYLRSSKYTYSAVLKEDRSGADYQEGWFGTFTITSFMAVVGKDLKFKVNRDKTITILNGVGTNADGWVAVETGLSSVIRVNKIYIDESSTVFDFKNSTLTFTATNNGTGSNLIKSTQESITWTIQEEDE